MLNTGWSDVMGCIHVYFNPMIDCKLFRDISTLDCRFTDLLTSVTVYSLPRFDLHFDLWVGKTLWHQLDCTFNKWLWPWLWPVWAGLENPMTSSWLYCVCTVSTLLLISYRIGVWQGWFTYTLSYFRVAFNMI